MQITPNIVEHLNSHQAFPASKASLMKECNNLSDLTDEEKSWVDNVLPDKTYSSADEVINVLMKAN